MIIKIFFKEKKYIENTLWMILNHVIHILYHAQNNKTCRYSIISKQSTHKYWRTMIIDIIKIFEWRFHAKKINLIKNTYS